jgi:hypothetical protein
LKIKEDLAINTGAKAQGFPELENGFADDQIKAASDSK